MPQREAADMILFFQGGGARDANVCVTVSRRQAATPPPANASVLPASLATDVNSVSIHSVICFSKVSTTMFNNDML